MSRKRATAFLSGPMQIDLRKELESTKRRAKSRRKQKDLIWHKLCGVVATSGSTVHAKEFMDMYEERLQFGKLPTNKTERTKAIYNALVDAKIPRMQKQKASDLSSNYEIVKAMGGPEKATKIMLSLKGKEEKMAWVRQFKGVGPKYSRNIWMDLCDPDFADSIALDARVKSFAEKIGFNKRSKNLEADLLEFAKSCNLSGWELDRLIFNYGSLILQKL